MKGEEKVNWIPKLAAVAATIAGMYFISGWIAIPGFAVIAWFFRRQLKELLQGKKLQGLFRSHWDKAMAEKKENGLLWVVAYYGGFIGMFSILLLVPAVLVVARLALADISLLGPVLIVVSRPHNLAIVTLILCGLVFWKYSFKLFPEGIMIREIVLDRTARSLRGGKFHFYHPFARLKGYFMGEHTIDGEDPKHPTNARVLSRDGFSWDVDLALVFKAQDITLLAGTEFEKDIDSLWLGHKRQAKPGKPMDDQPADSDGLTMEDLTRFDLGRIEQTQLIRKAYVAMQNQVGVFFQGNPEIEDPKAKGYGMTADSVQTEAAKKELAAVLEKVVRQRVYRRTHPTRANARILPDDQQPVLIHVRVNQIVPSAKTQADLGSIAKVERLRDKGLITEDDAAEIFKREALSGGGGIILESGAKGRRGGKRK